MTLYTLESMDQIARVLNSGPGYGGYNDLFDAINLPDSELEAHCTWKDNRYTRNCIASCDDYELLLMCWKKDHASPIHNFKFQQGWIKVLKGELYIQNYEIDYEKFCCYKKDRITLSEGESTYLNDSMGFHQVLNANDGKTISLHLNIEKVKQWEVFRDCRQETILVEPLLDSKSTNCE